MRSLDANIFLHFFAGDDETKTEACLELFQRVRRG